METHEENIESNKVSDAAAQKEYDALLGARTGAREYFRQVTEENQQQRKTAELIRMQQAQDALYQEQNRAMLLFHNPDDYSGLTPAMQQIIIASKRGSIVSSERRPSVVEAGFKVVNSSPMDGQLPPKRSQAIKYTLTQGVLRRMLAATAACATIATLGLLKLGDKAGEAIQNYRDSRIVASYAKELYDDVISDNCKTKRTQDLMHYYYEYNYQNIADAVAQEDNLDIEIYLLIYKIGEEETSNVLKRVGGYQSLDDYISKSPYNDLEEFKTAAVKMILLENEIKEKQDEIDEIKSPTEEVTTNYEVDGIEGMKISYVVPNESEAEKGMKHGGMK